jgi:hypothetical protein
MAVDAVIGCTCDNSRRSVKEIAVVNDSVIVESIQIAQGNWNKWRTVFEHGSLSGNPLLINPDLFAAFLGEYSVNRTIRAGAHEQFRQALAAESGQFPEAIRDDAGQGIDKLEEYLRPSFGTHDGKNRLVSALSKVAAFVRPERFVAWDRYAKRGVNVVLGLSASAPFNAYADYLATFDKAWNGQPGQGIRDYVARNAARGIDSQPRFLRRVLDVYLMKRGGRKL